MPILFHVIEVSNRIIKDKRKLKAWLHSSLKKEGFLPGDINYIFCSDSYLYQKNVQFLNHDTYTDIITFEYNDGKTIHADIFISTERVTENAEKYEVSTEEELRRVMIHGLLHLCGYKDKKKSDKKLMTQKEDFYLRLFKNV